MQDDCPQQSVTITHNGSQEGRKHRRFACSGGIKVKYNCGQGMPGGKPFPGNKCRVQRFAGKGRSRSGRAPTEPSTCAATQARVASLCPGLTPAAFSKVCSQSSASASPPQPWRFRCTALAAQVQMRQPASRRRGSSGVAWQAWAAVKSSRAASKWWRVMAMSSQLRGIGGSTQNFELQKSGITTSQLHRSRMFLRQTFGLGGESVVKTSDPMQL